MIISLKTGDVYINNKRIHLTRNEMTVISLLNKNEITTLKEIYEHLYNVNVKEITEDEKRCIYIIISRIRKKITEGIRINNVYGYGYRIEVLNG